MYFVPVPLLNLLSHFLTVDPRQDFQNPTRQPPALHFTMSTTTTTTQAEPITAESILRLFPDIDTSSAELEGHDEEQIRLMDEVCIVLDENDKPIGNFSKKICKALLKHPSFS